MKLENGNSEQGHPKAAYCLAHLPQSQEAELLNLNLPMHILSIQSCVSVYLTAVYSIWQSEGTAWSQV